MSIAIDSLQYLGFRLFGGLLSTFASTANRAPPRAGG